MTTVLTVDQLSCRQGNVTLFNGLSFTLTQGDILCISAPSGYGKSTLLKCIAELIDYDGIITLLGHSSHSMGVPEWRRRVQYVPQQSGLLDGTPADFWARITHFKTRTGKEWEDPILLGEQWALPRRTWDQKWQEVSGGERQRLVLAMSLALHPDVLLLDEPTSALDARTTELVETTLRQRQITAIWISHDQAQITRVASKTLVLA